MPEDEAPLAIPADAPLSEAGSNGTPRWLPAVLGVTLVVVLLVVLASCLGGDEDDEPLDRTAERPTNAAVSSDAAAEQRPVDLGRRLRVKAPPAAPPTQDLDGQLADYEAANMLDGSPMTTWRTPGDATGETITFTLAKPATVRRVGIINGFAKQVPSGNTLVDWYPNNRRITAVEWVFDDGTTVRQDLSEKPKLQRLTIDPISTSTVRLRLLGVTPPGPGVLGRDYTAISDVLIAGVLSS
ncbi:discoidin domain-containing protein [Nocardioides piscis]|uniref:Discoidin domain-containing protein n=1 Tax=Nocardioides piscis TaxID=2714938 RepID=A0A6G7YJF5_9ACTN|nr:discoidin domain-containing protein [Nocardioides piscis]QIK76856.1 discoidin domain-containing protein [Nocardioides piscis]